MMSKKQRLGITAAVAGMGAMGVFGWWVGGLSREKPKAVVEIQPTPVAEVTPAHGADNGAVEATDRDGGAPAIRVDAARVTFRDPNGQVPPAQVQFDAAGNAQRLETVQRRATEVPTGNVVVFLGPAVRDGVQAPGAAGADGPVKWLPPENTLNNHVVTVTGAVATPNRAGVTITGGNGAGGIATVDGNGRITSIRVDNPNGQTFTINGNMVFTSRVVQPADGAKPADGARPVDAGKGTAGGLP